jgi:hypothetical protein
MGLLLLRLVVLVRGLWLFALVVAQQWLLLLLLGSTLMGRQ